MISKGRMVVPVAVVKYFASQGRISNPDRMIKKKKTYHRTERSLR